MYFKNQIFNIFYFILISSNLFANVTMNIGQCNLDGTMSVGNGNLNFGKICGTGQIIGNNFTMKCNEFNFRGTIESNGECIIRCKKPFDYNSFTRKGNGSITVIISPYDFESFTKDELIDTADNLLVSNFFTNDISSLDDQIKSIRYYAASNKIKENIIFESVVDNLDNQINYHELHLDEKYDTKYLKRILGDWTLAGIGLAPSYIFYKYKSNINKIIPSIKEEHMATGAFLGLILTCFSVSDSLPAISACLNPKHKEKFEKLTLIKEKIYKSLESPYILEKEQVIKLQ